MSDQFQTTLHFRKSWRNGGLIVRHFVQHVFGVAVTLILLLGVSLSTGCISWTVNTKAGQPTSESVERQNHTTGVKNVSLKATSAANAVNIEANAKSEYVIVEKRSVSGPAIRQRATLGLFPGSELVYKKNVGGPKLESYNEKMGVLNLLNPLFLWDLYVAVVGGGAVVAVCIPIATTWTTLVSPWYSLEGEAGNEELLYMGFSLFGCVRQSLPVSGTSTKVTETVSDEYFTHESPLAGCAVECEIPALGLKNRQILDYNGKTTFKVYGKQSGYVDVKVSLSDVSGHEHSKYLLRYLNKPQAQQVFLSQ